MLHPAKAFEEKLNIVYQSVILEQRMKWWHMEYENTVIEVNDSFWTDIQLVSVKDKKVQGYFSAHISRPENFINSLSCINFKLEDPMTFAMDLMHFINFLLYKKNFGKVNWEVVIGNPVETHYDSLCTKLGGRIVGIKKHNTLIDGKYYDLKMYELINDYYECTNCGDKKKGEDEIMCWKCGIGEMIYHNKLVG